MKKYFYIIGIIFLLGFKNVVEISGKYKIVYDSKYNLSQESNYTIKIKNNSYTKFINGNKIKGGITVFKKTTGEKTYYFKDFLFIQNKIPTDSVRFKSFGKVIMEVNQLSKDTLAFRTTYEGQLQITINTGKFIRKN